MFQSESFLLFHFGLIECSDATRPNMLAIERLELSTLALLARCSNRLSYTALISILGDLYVFVVP